MSSSTLRASILKNATIPESAKIALSSVGVPDELRLPGWVGPTLFTSEIRDGELRRLEDAFPSPGGAMSTGYLLGTIRETIRGPSEQAYAAFVIEEGQGRVYLVDLDDPRSARLTNSSLEHFLRSLELFYEAWPALTSDHEPAAAAALTLLQNRMAEVDPEAWKQDDSYWATWVEELVIDR